MEKFSTSLKSYVSLHKDQMWSRKPQIKEHTMSILLMKSKKQKTQKQTTIMPVIGKDTIQIYFAGCQSYKRYPEIIIEKQYSRQFVM